MKKVIVQDTQGLPTVVEVPEQRQPAPETPRTPPTILTDSDSLDAKVAAFDALPSEQRRATARALAAETLKKYQEKKKAEREAEQKGPFDTDLITPEYEAEEIERKKEIKAEIDKKLEQEKHKEFVSIPGMANVSKATTPAGIQKMLMSLNINLNVQLTRTDTKNLLATLLTCNEQQLIALSKNGKVPIVIKTVIKRLLDDSKTGSMEAINDLWDRIFGKNGLSLEMPTDQGALPGLIPGQPVSREAYVILRETIIGGK